jgi:chromosome segregation ATPase
MGKGRKMKGAAGEADEELADLQRRFSALEEEGKTAAATAMITPRSMKRTQHERSTAAAVRESNDGELARLDDQITTLRRKHDELAHANMEKRRELEKLTDRLQDLSKEAKMPSAEDSQVVKEIKALEARLGKAVAKYEDAYEVRRTYEQIVKRLKEERIGFANQLEARELTLAAKEGDYEELLLMSHDANQSKELAKQELSKFEALVSEERKLREKVRGPPNTIRFDVPPHSLTLRRILTLTHSPTHPLSLSSLSLLIFAGALRAASARAAQAGDQRRPREAGEAAARGDGGAEHGHGRQGAGLAAHDHRGGH